MGDTDFPIQMAGKYNDLMQSKKREVKDLTKVRPISNVRFSSREKSPGLEFERERTERKFGKRGLGFSM